MKTIFAILVSAFFILLLPMVVEATSSGSCDTGSIKSCNIGRYKTIDDCPEQASPEYCNACSENSGCTIPVNSAPVIAQGSYLAASGLSCIAKAIKDKTGETPSDRWIGFVSAGVSSLRFNGKYLTNSKADNDKMKMAVAELITSWGYCTPSAMRNVNSERVAVHPGDSGFKDSFSEKFRTEHIDGAYYNTEHTWLADMSRGAVGQNEDDRQIFKNAISKIFSVKKDGVEKLFKDINLTTMSPQEVYQRHFESFMNLGSKPTIANADSTQPVSYIDESGNNKELMRSCLKEISSKKSKPENQAGSRENMKLCEHMMSTCELPENAKQLCYPTANSTSPSAAKPAASASSPANGSSSANGSAK